MQTGSMDINATIDDELLEQHYISQINRAIASGRDDLIEELTIQRDAEAARSAPLQALLKRAARHHR